MRAKLAWLVFASLVAGLAVSVRPVHAASGATEEARDHFRKGQQWFDLGRWDDAIDEFETAYGIRNDPTFLFNMAQACRRKGDARRALDLYKNYLMKAPKSPQRAEVEERIAALQKQVDEADRTGKALSPAASHGQPAASAQAQAQPQALPPPQPVAATPAPAGPARAPAMVAAPVYAPAPYSEPYRQPSGYPQPAPYSQPAPTYVQAPAEPPLPAAGSPGRGLRIAGIITCSTGLVAFAAGAAFGAGAKTFSDSVQSAPTFNSNDDQIGKLYQSLQWVSYGVGAGLVMTGAVLYGIGAVSGKRAAVALVPTVSPGVAGLSAQGVF